jgi:S-adenosyl-L-methionine hydrolase (adenosine-forming)
MIALFTDFGLAGPYTGQVKAVLAREAPNIPVIDLFADAPAFDPRSAAYLLAAYAPTLPEGAVVMAIVDPGVGTERKPLIVEADGLRFVGPDNGLFEIVRRRARRFAAWTIDWRPSVLSNTFHGRDLFAPVAAGLARGERPPASSVEPTALSRPDWPDDLSAIVYIDIYGNALTGIRATSLPTEAMLVVGGRRVARGRTFADTPVGEALWYENANGLAEIAVNRGRADTVLDLRPGSPVTVW